MTIKDFDYKGFAENLAGQAAELVPKDFNNDEKAVANFINELDEIEELAESFKTDLEDFFRTEALERYYE